MNSLIKPDDVWMLWGVILAGVALSIWLEQKYTWAAKISGPVVALCIAMLLSNTMIMPSSTSLPTIGPDDTLLVELPDGTQTFMPADTDFDQLEKDKEGKLVKSHGVYEVVHEDLVPLALPLLLFRANLIHIIRSTGWLFLTFHFSVLGTMLGAIVGVLAVRNIGQGVAKINEVAGIMTGSYSGGAINFFAVRSSYQTETTLTNPLLVADSFIMAAMFLVLLLVAGSKWAKRLYPHPYTSDNVDSRKLAAEHWRRKEISLFDIAAAIAVAAGVVALSKLSSGWVGDMMSEDSPLKGLAGNMFLHITIWSMITATIGSRFLSRAHGAEEIGGYLLYIFLFAIGLPADLMQVIKNVPLLFVFCLIMALVNLLVTFTLGWIFRMNLEHLVLSVNATLGGPPSAAAMAISRGWSDLVLPSILVGIWGYAIGTACGLFIGDLIGRWLM